MFKITVFLLALASAALMIDGCKDPMEQPATDANGAAGEAARHLLESSKSRPYISPEKKALNDPQEPKEVASSTPSAKPYRIALCLAGIDKDFDAAFTAGAQDEAQKRSVTVDILSADGSASKQSGQLASLQKSGDGAAIVIPVDPSAVSGEVAALKSAQIPVVSAVQKLSGALSSVVSDEQKAGQTAIITIWGGILKSQSGTVGVISFKGDPIQQERLDGYNIMAPHVPPLKGTFAEDLSQNTAQAAQAKAAEMLKAHPNISAFFTTSDGLAVGVSNAITAAKSDAGLLSIGADAEAREQIKSGHPWFADVIEYPHLMGVTSLDAAVNALQGNKPPANIVLPVAVVSTASFK